MSAIYELMKETTKYERSDSFADSTARAALSALPDIKRIVEWILKDSPHEFDCAWVHDFRENGEDAIEECDCGLSEIQSLIRR